MDGDGKEDLAIAYTGTPVISILRNTGTIGTINFAAAIDLGGLLSVRGLVINDVDGDGKADVAASNGGYLTIFRNTGSSGNISFAAKVDVGPALDGNYSLAAGDLDGDGKADLVAGNNTAFVSVFRNTSTIGNISYAGKVDLIASGPNIYSIALGDLTGDGRVDVAATSVNAGSVSVFTNTSTPGTISLDPKVDFSTGPQVWSIAIGDLDGDGMPDLAVAKQSGSNTVSTLRNNLIAIPTITSFTPPSGPVGTPVTITGTNFNAYACQQPCLLRCGQSNTYTGGSTTSLTVMVPPGATSIAPLIVQDITTGLQASSITSSTKQFTVTTVPVVALNYCSSSVPVGDGPRPVAVTDFNNDGKADFCQRKCTYK